jgi:hypothetical protein
MITRPVALALAVVAAIGSVSLMLKVGHRNSSLVLLALFTGWVLAPFLALIWANKLRARSALQVMTVIVAAGSLIAYGYAAFSPPMAKPAAPFLMVPLTSWVLIAATMIRK